MSNGGGGGKGFLVVLICLAIIGGGGYLIYKNTDFFKEKPKPTDKEDPPKYTTGPKTVKEGQEVEVPFIFWGGDVATFHANGGLETTADSLFGKKGLKCK